MYIVVVGLGRLAEDRAESKAPETEGHTRGQVFTDPCEYIVYCKRGNFRVGVIFALFTLLLS